MNTVTIIVLLFCLLINIYECPVTRERKDGSRKHSECANKGKCKSVIKDQQGKYKERNVRVHVYTCMEKNKERKLGNITSCAKDRMEHH